MKEDPASRQGPRCLVQSLSSFLLRCSLIHRPVAQWARTVGISLGPPEMLRKIESQTGERPGDTRRIRRTRIYFTLAYPDELLLQILVPGQGGFIGEVQGVRCQGLCWLLVRGFKLGVWDCFRQEQYCRMLVYRSRFSLLAKAGLLVIFCAFYLLGPAGLGLLWVSLAWVIFLFHIILKRERLLTFL